MLHFQKIIELQRKVPSIFAGDMNFDIRNTYKLDENLTINDYRHLIKHYHIAMENCSFKKITKNHSKANTRPDLVIIKSIEIIKTTHYDGPLFCQNDGHDIIVNKCNVKLSNIIGHMTVNCTPKIDKDILYKFAHTVSHHIFENFYFMRGEYEAILTNKLDPPYLNTVNGNLAMDALYRNRMRSD